MKEYYLLTNGLRMRCLEWPGPRSGATQPTALLLHGLTSCAETWSLVAPRLAEGMRVLAPDLRGHGETDKPDHGYDHESLCHDLVGLLEALRVERVTVAGHSWGAGIAWTLALERPQQVSHLAFVEGGFFRPDRAAEPTEERLEQMLAPLEIYTSKETYLTEVQRHLPAPWTPELEAIALASVYQNSDGSVREKLRREHQKLILRAMWMGRSEERYRRLACPALILAAESGQPEAVERMARKRTSVAQAAQLLTQCTVQWVADSVHDVQLHRPEVVAEALREFFRS